ncbi:DUF946 domain-containing protein [Pseudomonas sp. CH235]|nr:DUF946 domain-containing protein [Pseudomonas sp. CH235]
MTMNSENSETTADRPMESIQVDNLLINFTTEFQRIWNCNGSGSTPCALWRPVPSPDSLPGFYPLGDVAISGNGNINGSKIVAVVREGPAANGKTAQTNALSPPDDFEEIWSDATSTPAGGTLWRPIAPEGYVALGTVCSINHEKPLLSSVRCVREDLVIEASVAELIWNDRGDRSRQYFSAWSIAPPVADAGAINFTAGTFIASGNPDSPENEAEAYSLRMQITVQSNPAPELPELSGFEAPEPLEPSQPTHTARLPWFAVEDHGQPSLKRFRQSPYYYLQRTDRYVLIGSSHNTTDKSSLFHWTLPRVLSRRDLRLFNRISAIQVPGVWPASDSTVERPIRFSARLGETFTHTETSSIGWTTPDIVAVAANVTKHKMMALYQLQSNYDLWRDNRTETAINFRYSDRNSLHWLEYPPEVASDAMVPLPSVPEQPESPELPESPEITDTAP